MKRAAVIAWALCLFCILLADAGLVGWLRAQSVSPALAELLQSIGWGFAIPALFAITAALINSRQPGNRIGWLLMLTAYAAAFDFPSDPFLAQPPTALTPGLWLLLWIENWAWIPLLFPILLIFLHFPDGRPPSLKWRWVNWLALAMWVLLALLIALQSEIGPFNLEWKVSNPIGILPPEIYKGSFIVFWSAGLLALTLGSVASLFVRYRRAGFVQREQIKWLLYAAAVFGVVYAMTVITSADGSQWAPGAWLDLLLILTIMGLPVAITIAILRYRLFDIDVIIRKTAVYGVLTGLLALVYSGSVVLLQTIFESVTDERSPIILVISTLLIAALFAPLQRRVQGWIDHRFFRQKYDAKQVLARFAKTARDEPNLDNLTGELVAVLQETLQPRAITLWLPEMGEKGQDLKRR